MERLTQWDHLTIGAGPSLRLTDGFRPEAGRDDAMLSVKVQDWRAAPESLDD